MGERYKKRRDRHRRMSVTVSPGVHRLDPLRRGSSSLSMNYLTTLGIIVADSESKNGKSRWTTSLQWHRPSPRERYKMHVTAGFLARLSARRLPILPTKRTTVASLRADRLETYSSGSAQDLHLFPSYSDERVSIGSPSLQRYIFLLIVAPISPIGLAEFFYRYQASLIPILVAPNIGKRNASHSEPLSAHN